MDEKKPYLSFVVVGRNDNYGYKFLERFQKFLDNLYYLCEKYQLNSELIIVEWNPPKKEKRLHEVLNFPSSKFLYTRIIEIPNKFHKKLKNEKNVPLFEYLGKNVAIRRARGEFVLITNPDIIFSGEIIKFLSEKKLEKDVLYRTSRYDLSRDIPLELAGQELLSFCKKNWDLEWNMRWGMSPRGINRIKYFPRMLARRFFPYLFIKYLPYRYHGGGPGDFTLLHKDSWKDIRAYPEFDTVTLLDFYGVILAIVKFRKIKRLRQKIFHQFHTKGKVEPDFQTYIQDSIKMIKTKKIIYYNDKCWGFEKQKFNEGVIDK